MFGLSSPVVPDSRHQLPRHSHAAHRVAAWQLTTKKDGILALGLKRVRGLASYQTALVMLHGHRNAMVRPSGRERLTGDVEADERSVRGVKFGTRGRRVASKVLVAIAVKQRSATGYGQARTQGIADATSGTLREFLLTGKHQAR